MSSEEFRDVVRPLTEPLAEYAVAIRDQPERHGPLPAHDSRAMAELAAEQAWAVPEWLEPIRNAHSYGGLLTYLIAEHLAAFAAIVDGTRIGPAYAHMPTVRALLETVPIAHWLLDPSIGIETRIQRSITFRLHSANQQGRMSEVPGAVDGSKKLRNACTEYAAHHGWAVANNAVAGQALPRPTHFSKVALGGDALDLDKTVWKMASATHHGNWFALVDGMKERFDRSDPLDQLGGIAPITADAQHLFMFGLLVFFGADAVVEARTELMGWPISPEIISSRRSLYGIGRSFTRHVKDSEPTGAAPDPRT